MADSRDPWLAANLSWTFAGLGQLYAGRRIAGAVFLLLEILLWAGYLAWALGPDVGTGLLAVVLLTQYALWSVSAFSAHRALRTAEATPPKNPWKSVFLTRIVPGLGRIYSGHFWIGLAWIAASLFLLLFVSKHVHGFLVFVGFIALRALVSLDSFLSLRRNNQASDRATAWTLALILVTSQSWLLGKALQLTVVEVFHIPSSAMEPTLLGNVSENHPKTSCSFAHYHGSARGDRILVSKLAYAASPVRRFDVAVFKYPLNQSKNFVKRVVGLPDETLKIHAGDLYVRPKGGSTFSIVRKPLEVQDRIWIRMHPEPDSAADVETFRRFWRTGGGDVSAGSQGGVTLSTSQKGAEFQPPIDDAQGLPVGDVRLSFEVRCGSPADVVARLVHPQGALELEFPRGKPGRLQFVKGRQEAKELPLQPGVLLEGRWHAVELMYYDGQAVVRLDSKVLGQIPLVDAVDGENARVGEFPTRVSFGAAPDGVSVRHVRVDRDIHYRGKDNREFGLREDEPLQIPANQYVCFGDHVANSHDARAWVKRTFVLKDGRKIVCETQQVNEGYSRFSRRLQGQLGLSEPPLYAIDGDEHGEEVAITREQFLREEEPQAFRFVDRRFFVGRVVKIWWPMARGGAVR